MKSIISLLTLFVASFGFAQNGINYKAVIKDNIGNVVANQGITIQFNILESATTVYQETQTPTTDANGIVIVNIGEGNPTAGTFSTIDWGGNKHFLNVQVNTGSGFVDMGTSRFKSVPYAIHAENVNGLEALDQGNGIGHRIIGRNLNNLGNIGLNAVDLSGSSASSSTYGATGEYSVAMNRQTTAQGAFSTAMGLDSKAYGATSTVMGFNTITNGFDAVAMGAYTIADAVQSLAIGRYNTGGGHNQIWQPTDPVFEIGIGSGPTARANALTVKKNGSVGIGTNQPDASALLQIDSNSKGVLVPRLTSIQMNSIGSPATSLLVYQTNGNPGFYYNAGTPASPSWQKVGSDPETSGNLLYRYASGTESFTVPTGVYIIYFEMVAGGGGHGKSINNVGGGGGGGGGFASGYIIVTPGEVLSLVIGGRGTNGVRGTPGTSGTSGEASSISSNSSFLVRTVGGSAGQDASFGPMVGQGGAGGSINSINSIRVKLTCTNWAAMAGGSGDIEYYSPNNMPVEGAPGSVNNIGSFNRNHRFSVSLLLKTEPAAIIIPSYMVLPFYGVGGSSGNAAQGGYMVLNW